MSNRKRMTKKTTTRVGRSKLYNNVILGERTFTKGRSVLVLKTEKEKRFDHACDWETKRKNKGN